jgi:hypothetical protein
VLKRLRGKGSSSSESLQKLWLTPSPFSRSTAEAILLRAQAVHPKVAMIAFNLACYASVMGRMEQAKERLQHAIKLDKHIRGLALDDENLKPLWDWIAGLE